MFGWLLEVVDSEVLSDIIKPDNIPDGYIMPKTNNDLITGMLIGFCFAVFLWVIIKLSIFLFKKSVKDINNQEDD